MQEFVPKKWPITLVFMGMEEKDPELNVSQWMAFLIVLSCAVSTAIADSKASDDFCFTI